MKLHSPFLSASDLNNVMFVQEKHVAFAVDQTRSGSLDMEY